MSFGDDSKVAVKGKGNILIWLKNGKHQFISNVYYVPNMKSNILSLGQLLEKGYDIHLKDNNLSIRDNIGSLIAKVSMSRNRMFLLNIQNDVAKCLKAYYKDPLALASSTWASQLWRIEVIIKEKDGERPALHQSTQTNMRMMFAREVIQEKLSQGVEFESAKAT